MAGSPPLGAAGTTLRFKVQLVVVSEDDEPVSIDDLLVLNKDQERLEHLGLTLAESKALLLELQRHVLTRQISAFLAVRRACPACGRARGIKDRKTIQFRTVFGNLAVVSPRLRRCPGQPCGPASGSPLGDLLSEHTAPELLYLESKWASLVSYGLTTQARRDFLPVDARLNAMSVRRHTWRVARRCEAQLRAPGEPLGRQADRRQGQPGAVGIDGGELRHWARKQSHFVAVVGKSVPSRGAAKCFGFVQSQDAWPRRRLAATLRAQGLRPGSHLTFLSDGEDSLCSLQWHLGPHSQHLPGWFHLAMRLQELSWWACTTSMLPSPRRYRRR